MNTKEHLSLVKMFIVISYILQCLGEPCNGFSIVLLLRNFVTCDDVVVRVFLRTTGAGKQ